MIYQDVPEAIRIAKLVLSRYADQDGPGVDHVWESAASLIMDIHFSASNDEADAYYASVIADPSVVIGDVERDGQRRVGTDARGDVNRIAPSAHRLEHPTIVEPEVVDHECLGRRYASIDDGGQLGDGVGR